MYLYQSNINLKIDIPYSLPLPYLKLQQNMVVELTVIINYLLFFLQLVSGRIYDNIFSSFVVILYHLNFDFLVFRTFSWYCTDKT